MRVSQNHPRFNEIEAYAENRLNNEFNNQQMDNVETVLEKAGTSISKLIVKPSFKVLALEWLGDLDSKEEAKVYREYLEDRNPAPDEDEFTVEGVWEEYTSSVVTRLLDGTPDTLDEEDMPEDCNEDDFYEWLENESNYNKPVEIHYDESEHYPMWNTLFEANSRWMSEKLEEMVDELYDIGIGVIGSSDEFEAMMFIGDAGYDFYEAHWIPLFIALGWLDLSKYPEPDKKLVGCNHCGRTEFVYSVEMKVEARGYPGELNAGCCLTGPLQKENQYPKVLRCTYCGTEHSESNFVWEV